MMNRSFCNDEWWSVKIVPGHMITWSNFLKVKFFPSHPLMTMYFVYIYIYLVWFNKCTIILHEVLHRQFAQIFGIWLAWQPTYHSNSAKRSSVVFVLLLLWLFLFPLLGAGELEFSCGPRYDNNSIGSPRLSSCKSKVGSVSLSRMGAGSKLKSPALVSPFVDDLVILFGCWAWERGCAPPPLWLRVCGVEGVPGPSPCNRWSPPGLITGTGDG